MVWRGPGVDESGAVDVERFTGPGPLLRRPSPAQRNHLRPPPRLFSALSPHKNASGRATKVSRSLWVLIFFVTFPSAEMNCYSAGITLFKTLFFIAFLPSRQERHRGCLRCFGGSVAEDFMISQMALLLIQPHTSWPLIET